MSGTGGSGGTAALDAPAVARVLGFGDGFGDRFDDGLDGFDDGLGDSFDDGLDGFDDGLGDDFDDGLDEGLDEGLGDGAGGSATRMLADELTDAAPAALASAVSSTCSPGVAWPPTGTLAARLPAWPTSRVPRLQVVPPPDGQLVNAGELMPVAGWTMIVTVVSALVAWVVQTVIA